MGFILKSIEFIDNHKKKVIQKNKDALLLYLADLKKLEANLWGVNIVHLKNGEEDVLEDSNHLIYLVSREEKHIKLKNILKNKEFIDFIKDLDNLKSDFNFLKKKITQKNKLKSLISNFTIKSVKPENYSKMKNIFLFEKKLYDIIEKQDTELNDLFSNIKSLKFDTQVGNVDLLIDSLKNIRNILAGHHDLHSFIEDERLGFSNTSNIIYELEKTIKSII